MSIAAIFEQINVVYRHFDAKKISSQISHRTSALGASYKEPNKNCCWVTKYYVGMFEVGTLWEAVAQVSEMTSPKYDVDQTMSYQWIEDTPFEVIEVK